MTKSTLPEFANVGTNDQGETNRYRSAIGKPQDSQQIRSSAPSCSRSVGESPVLTNGNTEKRVYFLDNLRTFSPALDRIILWLSFMVSMFSVVYLMIQTFRFYLDKQGKLWNELNRNSYYVYIIHVVVMGVLATLMLDWETSSLLKYLILTLSTFAACNVMISFCRWLVGSVGQKTKKAEVEIVS